MRAFSLSIWFTWAVVVSLLRHAPVDIVANVPWIGAYLAFAVAALAARRLPPFRTHAWFTLPFVDVPFIFAIHLNGLRLWDGRYIAGLATAMFVLLVLLSGHALRPSITYLTAALGAAAESVLMRAAGLGLDRMVAVFILFTVAALIMVYFPRRMVQLVAGAAEQRERLRTLERYFSPSVARVIADQGTTEVPGQQREVTVLFVDMRDFTGMVEKMEGPAVVAFLNAYHEAMVEVVFRFDGTLDKFMGDGLMAYFGAPLDQPDHDRRAVQCALDMLGAVAELNRKRAAEGAPPFRVGVGVHTGQVIVGHIGSQRFREYGAVGDTVNLAARIEGLTKELGYPVLCSETTRLRLGDAFAWLDAPPAQVRGRSAAVRTYSPRVLERGDAGGAPAEPIETAARRPPGGGPIAAG